MTSDSKSTLVSAEVIARYLLAKEKSRKHLKIVYHHFHEYVLNEYSAYEEAKLCACCFDV